MAKLTAGPAVATYGRPACTVRGPRRIVPVIQMSCCDGKVFRGGSAAAAAAAAAEPAARMADASTACERCFMVMLPSDVLVLIPGVSGESARVRRCAAAQ